MACMANSLFPGRVKQRCEILWFIFIAQWPEISLVNSFESCHSVDFFSCPVDLEELLQASETEH